MNAIEVEDKINNILKRDSGKVKCCGTEDIWTDDLPLVRACKVDVHFDDGTLACEGSVLEHKYTLASSIAPRIPSVGIAIVSILLGE
jgi:hypothetical protein